jgi:Ca2+-binding RTX toxin-like protein
MSSVTVAGINLGNVNEGSEIPFGTGTASFDNVWEVISQAYPTADRSRTSFGFSYALSGTANTADFNADDLTFSQLLVFTNGFVGYSGARTIDDTTIEGNEAFSFQPVLLTNLFALDIRSRSEVLARLNPDEINALFAAAGGITFNIGALTGTILDNDDDPTNLSLSNAAIAENSAIGTVIGSFSTTDPDTISGFTYALVPGTGATDNAAFTLDGDRLKLAILPDFEIRSSYSIRVRTTDPDNNIYEKSFTVSITDVVENTAPTDLTLSSTSVNENVADNTSVGSFSTTDAEGGNFTYELISGTGDTDNSAFTIVGNELKINSYPDFEAQSSYSIRVKTTDAGGLSFEKVLTLSINDVNEAPVFTSSTTATFEENKTDTVYTASATDPEKAALSYSLDGTDAALFAIDESTGAVTFKTAPNFEAPADSNQNNVYDITVTASTAVGPSVSRAVAITVNNINEAPTVTGETVSTSQNTGNPVTSITVELGDNLSDPDVNGLANALLNVTGTTNGTIASIDQDARLVSFTPTAGFSGTASFNYTLTDAGGLTSNTATVTLEVGSVISTGNRNQEIEGNNGDDIISAGNGSDRILGLGGNDRLFGNNGNDFLDGGEGNDSLFGGNGTDTLLGGNGNDLLDGGNGPDIVTGGAGSDGFVLTASAGGDTFTDFADTIDRIVLSGGLTFGQLTIAASGGNTAILLGTTTLATLTGITSGIDGADFVTL